MVGTMDGTEAESAYYPESERLAELLARIGASLDDKVRNPPIDPYLTRAQWEHLAHEPVPLTPAPVDELVDELISLLIPNGGRVSDPGFWAFVTTAPTTAPLVAATAAALGAPVRYGFQAVNAIEERSLEWLGEIFGLPAHMKGLYSSGGSSANIVAMGAARQHAFEARGLDPARDGVTGTPCAFYVSPETHHTILRAAAVLGIGRSSVREIPVDDNLHIRTDLLAEAIDADIAAGVLPIAVIANAGATNTGTIDPLRAVATVAHDRGVWFHIDGAYGLPGYLDERVRPKYDGLELADSIIVDPHKWLSAPAGIGVTFVRDRTILLRAFTQGPADYLEGSFADDGRIGVSLDSPGIPYGDFGLELTAPSRGIQVWAILREQGVSGLTERIRRDNDFATYVARTATDDPRLESLTNPDLSVACIRYIGDGSHSNDELNELNRRIHRRLVRETEFLPSTTVVKGAYTIRPCFISPRATWPLIEAFLPTVVRLGDEEAAGSMP